MSAQKAGRSLGWNLNLTSGVEPKSWTSFWLPECHIFRNLDQTQPHFSKVLPL